MRIAFGMTAATLLLIGCHSITEELPTEPTKTPSSGVLTVPIPSIPVTVTGTPTPVPAPTSTPAPAPAPTATPAPAPTATPAPAPPPAPAPTPAPTPVATPAPAPTGGCGNPLPPPVSRMKVKIHLKGPNRWTLDSTPLVHDAAYCAKIGYYDRADCPVRMEGSPDRAACEEYAIGRARDTGRPGPTWYRNGKLCNGTDCENHEENQYLLWVYLGGLYKACTDEEVCGEVEVDK